MNKTRLGFCWAFLLAAIFAVRSDAAIPLKTLSKAMYPPDDFVITGVDPNLLFLLDTGSPMAFSPKGAIPLKSDALSLSQRAALLQLCTYGVGARPMTIITKSGSTETFTEQTALNIHGGYSRYGRDVDSTNNIIGNIDCYYTSDPSKPYLLTFQNPAWANWTNWDTAYPSGFPPALVPYMPKGANFGKPVPDSLKDHLVPNDSRMYTMKLVLWRLTDSSNAEMLSKMNLGMATSYQETNYATASYVADFYKTAGAGAKVGQNTYYGATSTFQWGNAPSWATGTGSDGVSAGGNYYMSQKIFAGVDRGNYTYGATTPQWRQVNRAVLKTPFNKFYTPQTDGSYLATDKLLYFRQFMDGVESSYVPAPDGRPRNPEMVADGQTPLSTSIYGRKNLKTGATLHAGQYDAATSATNSSGTQQFLIQYAPNVVNYGSYVKLILDASLNSSGLSAGQAVGSVIDFFSPLPGSARSNGLAFNASAGSNTLGFFPVTGACQSNWLVLFTAANDSDPAAHTADQAALQLFKDTQTMRGRLWNGSQWVETNFAMDSGVRTLVVGFVDPLDPSLSSVSLRNSLHKIAQAGDPVESPDKSGNFIPNPSATPYFANDVPSLIQSLMSILKRIYVDKMATGAPVVQPMVGGAGGNHVLFGASYKINPLDQWGSWLNKFTISGDVVTPVWEAGTLMRQVGLSRPLYTSTGGVGSPDIAVKGVASLSGTELLNLARIPPTYAARFQNWLLQYDSGMTVLGDMEHSGITVVSKPTANPLLNDLSIANRPSTLYIQTNRGVLHALDYETGSERWAFMPPNIFQFRAKDLKFQTGTDSWYGGDGLTGIRSQPSALLDGMLVARDVKGSDGNYRTMLVGALGWGGNGFYMMDVTRMQPSGANQPQFLWAIDNARYSASETESIPVEGVKRWGKATSRESAAYDYSDLGLTIMAGVLLSPQGGDVGVIPGGLGYPLGLNADTHGKAFYFFKPEDGSILKKIDSHSKAPDFSAPRGRFLGMGVTPITYQEDSSGKAVSFFTADSEGNILFCDTTRPVRDWTLKSIFQLRTTSAPDPYTNAVVAADLPVAIPKALLTARTHDGNDWVFGGTADLMAPGDTEGRTLTNAQQFIFGLNLNKASGDVTIAKLKRWTYFTDGILPIYSNTAYDASKNTVEANDAGWYLKLRPKMADARSPSEAEYVTTDPYLYNGVLYVSTFVPRTRSVNSARCPELGDSKLYVMNPLTGRSYLDGKQAIVLHNIKVAGISALGNKLYISVKQLKAGAIDQVTGFNGMTTVPDASLISAAAWGGTLVESSDIIPNIPHIHYWRESFR